MKRSAGDHWLEQAADGRIAILRTGYGVNFLVGIERGPILRHGNIAIVAMADGPRAFTGAPLSDSTKTEGG